MNLKDKLFQETILVPLVARNREDAIQELLTHLKSLDILSETTKLFSNIKEQESVSTSATGRGIAYPHSMSVELNELVCILGKSIDGIEFNSPDGHLCHLILLTLSPENDPLEHRKFISHFRNMVNNPSTRASLFEATNSEDIMNIIYQWEENEAQSDELE